MRYGLCVPYGHNDYTYAALHVAEWLTFLGHDVAIRPSHRANPIGQHWDGVARRGAGRVFTEWASSQDRLAWFGTPLVEQIRWAAVRKKRPVVFSGWHDLPRAARRAYDHATHVFAPNDDAVQFFRTQWRLANVVPLLYCPPPPAPQPYDGPPSILFRLVGHDVYGTQGTGIELLGTLMARRPEVLVSVAYSAATLSSAAKRRLRQFRKLFPRQLKLCGNLSYGAQGAMLAQHDFCIWPAQRTVLGWSGRWAYAAGTPLLTFITRQPTKPIPSQLATLLVSCASTKTELGMPAPIPDYPTMLRRAEEAVRNCGYYRTFRPALRQYWGAYRTEFYDCLAAHFCG